MTVTVTDVGFFKLDAPLPQPRRDDLLAVVPPEPLPATSWLGGGWTEGRPPGPAYTHDPCSTGSMRVKASAGDIATQQARLFNVYMPAHCVAKSIGPNLPEFIDRLEQVFLVYERAAVERALATGDGMVDVGAYLGDANMELLALSAVPPVKALRLLEAKVALHGSGIIHAAPSTVVAWDALNLTCRDLSGLTVTKRGTTIAVGAGYTNVVPDGMPALTDDEQWAFATGPIEILRSPDIDVPARAYADNLDFNYNEAEVIAERPYLFNWVGRQDVNDDAHVQAGVLIDESCLFCCSPIDGGSP